MLDKFESITKFFPLIFIVLMTLGYIHLQSYYYFFDINILNYLDVTEIIFLFFNKSILIILGILTIVIVSYILDHKVVNLTSEKNELSERSQMKKILKGSNIIIFLAIVLYIILVIIFENYIALIYPIGYMLCAVLYFILEKYFFKVIFINHTLFFSLSCVTSFVLLVVINLSTLSSSIEKGYNVRYKELTVRNISFSYNDNIIKTSRKLRYIGETKNNLFLFDSDKKETIILRMENIDNLRITIE